MKIKKVSGREILDSRGHPTVEVDVLLAGSVCRGERTAKYNQLLRIEEELGARCVSWEEGVRCATMKKISSESDFFLRK